MKIISNVGAVLLAVAAFVTNGAADGPATINVRADALAKAYSLNELAADSQYKGRRVTIGGVVEKVGRDHASGMPFLIIKGPEFEDVPAETRRLSLKCLFPAAEVAKLTTVKSGGNAYLSGTVAGKTSENLPYVVLRDCKM